MTTIHVKATSGAKITVSVELGVLVSDLKQTLASSDKANVPASQQRLIYRGHVMKDERTLESYGLAAEHTVHLVKGLAPGAAVAATPAAPAPIAPSPANNAGNMGGGFGGMGGMGGGMGGFGGGAGGAPDFNQMQQQLQQNPGMMRDMLNSPMMRGAMDEMSRNPEMLRQMINADPRMREVIEQNPELGHALNDPETLRRTFEVAANPNLMAEQMRLTDRSLANIEAHPEGFNALSRMHNDVSEPMMRAAEGRGVNTTNSTLADPNNPFAAMFAANPVAGVNTQTSNTAAGGNAGGTPDPWAPHVPGSNPAGGGNPGNPFASMFGGMGGGGGGGDAMGMGGLGGMGGGMAGRDPQQMLNQMEQMLENPVMAQMMREMMSNPEVFQQMIDSDPALRHMTETNPGMREMLSNPEMLRQMTNPDTLRSQDRKSVV